MMIDELLSQYESARQAGQELTPEELCRKHPELLEQVRRQTRALRNISTPADGPTSPLNHFPQPVRAETDSDYEIVRPFARGGLGEILVARDDHLGREVALKVIGGAGAALRDRRDRFVREAKITSRLEHPGIVPVYGLGSDNEGRPCYAMRLVQGQTLGAAIELFHSNSPILRRSNPAFRNLLNRLTQVCQTIAYAHRQNVIHRDLKPSNIILGEFGETVVIDWGLAKVVGHDEPTLAPAESARPEMQETVAGSVLGTPAFMSPEQAQSGEVSAATDVFALGGLLYCVLTGKAPYSDVSSSDANRRIAAGDFPRPRARRSDIPAALEAVCLKALAVKPGDRYADAQLLAADVERWLADLPVSVGRDPLSERIRRWVQNHRLIVTTSAASLLVGMIGLAIATGLLSRKNEQLSDALKRAETGEKAARTNFGVARDAVDRFATRVGEDPRLKQKDAERLRKDLLAMAVDFNQRLAESEQSDASMAIEAARAHMRLGSLAYQLGDPTAEQQIRAGITRLEALPANSQTEADRLLDLGNAWFAMGLSQQMRAKPDDALGSLEKCREVRTRLLTLQPDSAERKSELADVDQICAQVAMQKGQPLAGIELLQRAIELLQQNQKARPDVVKAWRNLPRAQNVMAMMLHMTRQFDRAEQTWQQALASIPDKLGDDDDGLGLRLRAAEIHRNLGNYYRERGNFPAAGESYQKCLQVTAELLAGHPAVLSHRAMHASGLFGLGTVQWELRDFEGAAAAMKAAYPIWLRLYEDQPSFGDNRFSLIGVEVYQGKLELKKGQPAAAAAKLRSAQARLAPMPADIMARQFLGTDWIAVAKADLTLATEAFGNSLTMAAQLAATPRTSRDAIVILRQLAAAGAFKIDALRQRLESTDFRVLQDQPAFQDLLKSITNQ